MVDETITESDIWADIDAVFARDERQPGDIDARQIMERYKIGENAARCRMKKLVASGEWKIVVIDDEDSGTKKRKVLRRVK